LRVSVLQSNYIPWRGYFDIIRRSDVFVFYDDVKFTKNDWRNRNQVKGPNGPIWLTIPCPKNYSVKINEVQPTNAEWQEKHWRTITQCYSKSPFFRKYSDFFEDFYLKHEWCSLSELNQIVIKHIAREIFGFTAQFASSSDFILSGTKESRLIDLLKKIGTSVYISGPSAKSYINPEHFKSVGIEIEWMDYGHYREYNQQFPPYNPFVSIVDQIFNVGPESRFFD
jgi:hypothetical protein